MKALILNAFQKSAQVQEIPKPSPSPTELLIRIHSIALNPVDALYTFNPLGATGRVIGSDFAGTVISLGSSIPSSSSITIGSRVAGFLQGACSLNDRPGAFAEYVVCPWDLVWKVPEGVGMEDASAVNLCGLTAAQALFYRMRVPAPFSWGGSQGMRSEASVVREDTEVCFFIYGASTSVGMYAAQLIHRAAAYHNFKIRLVGVASPRQYDWLKKEPYSYDYLVSYRDEDWLKQVQRYCAENGLRGTDYVYDCISEGDTVVKTAKLLVPKTGKMAIVRSREGGAWSAAEGELPIKPSYGAVWEGLGEEVQYQGMFLQASKEAREFAVAFYKFLSESGSSGKLSLQPNPVRLMPGGFGRVYEDGLHLLGSGSMDDRAAAGRREEEWMKPVSAEKLVYNILD